MPSHPQSTIARFYYIHRLIAIILYHNLQLCAKLSIFLHVCKLFITFASNEKNLCWHISFSHMFFRQRPQYLLPFITSNWRHPSWRQNWEICSQSHLAYRGRVCRHFPPPMDCTQRLEPSWHWNCTKLLVFRRKTITWTYHRTLCILGYSIGQTTPFSIGNTPWYRHRIRYQNLPKHHPTRPTIPRTWACQPKHRKCYQFSLSRSTLFGVSITKWLEHLSIRRMVSFQQW